MDRNRERDDYNRYGRAFGSEFDRGGPGRSSYEERGEEREGGYGRAAMGGRAYNQGGGRGDRMYRPGEDYRRSGYGQREREGAGGRGRDEDYGPYYEERGSFESRYGREPGYREYMGGGYDRSGGYDRGGTYDRDEGRGYGAPRGREDAWTQGPHAGRGPSNYSRSKDRIHEDVCERLTRHGHLDASGIEVSVEEGGEVTLNGTVDSREAKRRAEDIAESVEGVWDVHNRLRIQRGGADSQALAGDEQEKNGQAASRASRKGGASN